MLLYEVYGIHGNDSRLAKKINNSAMRAQQKRASFSPDEPAMLPNLGGSAEPQLPGSHHTYEGDSIQKYVLAVNRRSYF